MSMLYRSPLARWVLVATGLVAGAVLAFGDGAKWRSTHSFHWLAEAHIPLQTWGILFIVYALMLLPQATRPAGYALGAALFTLFAISLIATIRGDGPKNIVAVAGLVDVIVFHIYSVRTAWAARLAE